MIDSSITLRTLFTIGVQEKKIFGFKINIKGEKFVLRGEELLYYYDAISVKALYLKNQRQENCYNKIIYSKAIKVSNSLKNLLWFTQKLGYLVYKISEYLKDDELKISLYIQQCGFHLEAFRSVYGTRIYKPKYSEEHKKRDKIINGCINFLNDFQETIFEGASFNEILDNLTLRDLETKYNIFKSELEIGNSEFCDFLEDIKFYEL